MKLVDPKSILLPPVHIKLGLIKQFVKALRKRSSEAFQYIYEKFSKLSDAKIKEGIFNGPQIREIIKDTEFPKKMVVDKEEVWKSFVNISQKFLRNTKVPNYMELVEGLLQNYKAIESLMSLKVHFLDSHLGNFPENLGHFSEEQGERFHQDIKEIERSYQGFWDINMMADYCWNLKRDTNKGHKRKALRRSFAQTCRPHEQARKD
ncbi:unnamed protein product [Psylliodes chrysocephalus]|uniref:Uncharacterized protein n=1 Tax=Psylliodes chrysocephalus TaxID=3402493 RepID=A0A9P0CT98_9CUCU|nr:unnamed protein product [Psylliodes chrysocephala]